MNVVDEINEKNEMNEINLMNLIEKLAYRYPMNQIDILKKSIKLKLIDKIN